MNNLEKKMKEHIANLSLFRSNIPIGLEKSFIEKAWDIDVKNIHEGPSYKASEAVLKRKISIAKNSLNWLVLKPFVRFVGISGSVGSEFATDEDDIDLFIVTKNDTAWICRMYMQIRNMGKKKIRRRNEGLVEDKLCLNLFVEERALTFKSDIFNLNELLFLKPIYNKEYIYTIYSQNSWLSEKYLVSSKFLKYKKVEDLSPRNILLYPFNLIAFLMQLTFMLVKKHKPDIKRLINDFKKGCIKFYPSEFKQSKIQGFRNHSS